MKFSSDWHSRHIPLWEKHLGHLRDQPCQCLEIGSYEGRSAVWTIQNLLEHSDARLTCVDIWRNTDHEKTFDANIQETGRVAQVRKIKDYSFRALRELQLGLFDFVYIDGCHEARNVLEDAMLSFRLLKSGGTLIFDDYPWQGPGRRKFPREAIDCFLDLWADVSEVKAVGWQVVVKKLTGRVRVEKHTNTSP